MLVLLHFFSYATFSLAHTILFIIFTLAIIVIK